MLVGSLASFALGRMHLRFGWIITDLSLLTYVLPAAFLVIPFVHIMHKYGLTDSIWSVVAAQVAFATPYAILILHQSGKLIPMELDEAARIDGASPFQVYLRIYVPLMAPALVAVGVYALLLAWNEYLYQYLLLSSTRSMTVAVMINQFFDSDEAPWNYMMAIAIIYSVPPIAITMPAPLHGFRPGLGRGQGVAGPVDRLGPVRTASERKPRYKGIGRLWHRPLTGGETSVTSGVSPPAETGVGPCTRSSQSISLAVKNIAFSRAAKNC